MSTFSKRTLSFENTKAIPRIVLDYFDGKLPQEFINYSFSHQGLKESINQRMLLPVDRELIQTVIAGQYSELGNKISPSSKVDSNVLLLSKKNAFTVTTGHQLNVFTGPVYFIYKIITTINLSVKLTELFPDKNFIPVYWLASEDHDLEEINHIHLFGKKMEWHPESAGAAGRIEARGILQVIDGLKTVFGNQSKVEKLIQLFSKAYQDSNSLSMATRIIVHELFAEKGVVSIDADDARLKKLFLKEMKEDVEINSAFRLVNETIAELEKNYHVQVRPREINLFYLDNHSRNRIVEKDGEYQVLETNLNFNREKLFKEMDAHPEKFSPNVVLRPLYQEKILPNIAYIGGPAEIAYWLEYKKMFEHFGSKLPVLVMRNSMTMIDASSIEKLKKLGFEPEDLFMSEEELVKKFLKAKQSKEFSIEKFLKETESIYDEAIREVNEIDSTLKASVESEKQKIQNSLKSLEERIRRAEKRKHETVIQQLVKLKAKFFPGNALQERHENLLSFWSLYGEDFFNQLYRHFDPFERKFILLSEESKA